jgi:biopolymer transport protein ExbD
MDIPIRRRGLPDRVPIDMTPMIDIVFQLLAFFCMTLRVATTEGDFAIKMPLVAAAAGEPDPSQTAERYTLRMRADESGELLEMTMAQQAFTGPGDDKWLQLRQFIAGQVGQGSLEGAAEVELDCDYNLKYEYVIRAITAVSGDVGPDGRIIKLIEKINFAPRGPPNP